MVENQPQAPNGNALARARSWPYHPASMVPSWSAVGFQSGRRAARRRDRWPARSACSPAAHRGRRRSPRPPSTPRPPPATCLTASSPTGPVQGDTVTSHRETFLVEVPDIEGFDRIEVAVHTDDPAPARQTIATERLDAQRFLADPADRTRSTVAPAGAAGAGPAAPALAGQQVTWPEALGDPDRVTTYGNPGEGDRRIKRSGSPIWDHRWRGRSTTTRAFTVPTGSCLRGQRDPSGGGALDRWRADRRQQQSSPLSCP